MRTNAINLRDLYDAEQAARSEGRTDAADALQRRRADLADAECVCTTCGRSIHRAQFNHGASHQGVKAMFMNCACGSKVKKFKLGGAKWTYSNALQIDY